MNSPPNSEAKKRILSSELAKPPALFSFLAAGDSIRLQTGHQLFWCFTLSGRLQKLCPRLHFHSALDENPEYGPTKNPLWVSASFCIAASTVSTSILRSKFLSWKDILNLFIPQKTEKPPFSEWLVRTKF